MQIERLKIFCEVVRYASFSRGAAECGVSQSSASQAVHHLEERLGVKLIDRSTRPLVLTPQGRVYFEGCKDLIARYQGLENRVKALEDDRNVVGTVHVGSIYSVGLHHMSRYIERFQRLFPAADVKLDYLHPTRVVEGVQDGSVELGLISFPRKWPDLTVLSWRDEEMVLAAHPSHRLAGLAEIEPEALEGEPLVHFDTDLAIRRAIDRFLRSHDVQTRTVLEFDNIENIKRAVEIPAGLAILPRPTLSREIEAGTLAAVPFRGRPFHRPLAILHRGSGPPGLTASRFLKILTAPDDPAAVAPSGRKAPGNPR